MNRKKLNSYAPLFLRIGISLVFLWFGITQIFNPESFVGYLPEELYPHMAVVQHEHMMQWTHNLNLPSAKTLISANGLIELVLGILLIAGLLTRIVAGILSLHLFGIIISLGYNDLAVRDFGLMIATLTIFLFGPDDYCLDKKINRKLASKDNFLKKLFW